MAASITIYFNIVLRILQIAFAATILALSVSLRRAEYGDVQFLSHPPSLSFVASVSGLTIASGLFGLTLTWLQCLVKYGYVTDLLAVVLNLIAGTVGKHPPLKDPTTYTWKLLTVKVKWAKTDCPRQVEGKDPHNESAEAACGDPKWAWLIGDRCENMGSRCMLSRIASILSFIIVAMLLVSLALEGIDRKRLGPSAAEASGAIDNLLAAQRLTPGSEDRKSVQMAMFR